MPEIKVVNTLGEETGVLNLPDSIFGITPNKFAMHEAVVNFLANQRQGNKSALTCAEVSGGGRKPWRQKGTGHARQGSIRAPQWRHGGIVFAPKPRDFSYSINKKVKKLAIKSAFSSKFQESQIVVLDSLDLDEYKTKKIFNILKVFEAEKKALIILPDLNLKIIKSSRNIPGVKTSQANSLNTYDILNAGKVLIIKDSIRQIEEVYA